ncbi:MAG: pilin [Betaproteobacteria bacterium]
MRLARLALLFALAASSRAAPANAPAPDDVRRITLGTAAVYQGALDRSACENYLDRLSRFDQDHALTGLLRAVVEQCFAHAAKAEGRWHLACSHHRRAFEAAGRAAAMRDAAKHATEIASRQKSYESSWHSCGTGPSFAIVVGPAPLKDRVARLNAATEAVLALSEEQIEQLPSTKALAVLSEFEVARFAAWDDLLAAGLEYGDAEDMLGGLVDKHEQFAEKRKLVAKRIDADHLAAHSRAMLTFASYRKHQVHEAILGTGAVRTALQERWEAKGELPEDGAELFHAGLLWPGSRAIGVREVIYEKGTIVIHFDREIAPDGAVHIVARATKEGRRKLEWSCSSTASLRSIAPGSCK